MSTPCSVCPGVDRDGVVIAVAVVMAVRRSANSSLKFCWPKMAPICVVKLTDVSGTGVPSTGSIPRRYLPLVTGMT